MASGGCEVEVEGGWGRVLHHECSNTNNSMSLSYPTCTDKGLLNKLISTKPTSSLVKHLNKPITHSKISTTC